MTLTLGALLEVNNDVAFALFNSLRRSSGQRDAIAEAARASSLEPEELELITALLNVHKSIEAERTALAHGHFGIVDELSDGVIWEAANDYIHFQASMTLGPTAANYNEEKHRRLVQTLFVYRDSDLNQMIADFAWLGQYWSDFIAYHGTKNDSEKRAVLYRRLCGLSEHRLVDQRHLAKLDESARARVGVLPHRKPCHVQVRAVERRRAGQDTIVVLRKALRFHQRVLAAGGAASEIGLPGALPIERIGDLLAPHRHQVDRTVTEILDPLRMAEQASRGGRREPLRRQTPRFRSVLRDPRASGSAAHLRDRRLISPTVIVWSYWNR
jgi:hypothetical protein